MDSVLNAGPPTGEGIRGIFPWAPICEGPQKDRYTLIEQSTTLLKQSSNHGKGIIVHSLLDIDYYSFKSSEFYT